MDNLTPRQIVAELDKYIVGQAAAKRAIAVALRNRYRRQQLPAALQKDVVPKNILMIGPTGVGKTEIARRVARILDAPFLKVEATRFTEAGYVGEDVESIVFDLVDASIDLVHDQKLTQVQDRAEKLASERLVEYLYQKLNGKAAPRRRAAARRRGGRAESASAEPVVDETIRVSAEPAEARQYDRNQVAAMLSTSALDDSMIEIELSSPTFGFDGFDEGPPPLGLDDGGSDQPRATGGYAAAAQKRVRRVSVKEARRLLARDEANKLVDFEEIIDQAIQRAEQTGVVFIDELDKIAGPRIETGSDVSGEGVQRDLLPIVEGTTILTRYGPVKTDHVLFVGAGSFYRNKPSDLIPELQGRFPLRVELASLSREDFRRILVDTEFSLIKQTQELLATEGVELRFTDDAIDRIADVAATINENTENIGARRLQTVVERVVEEVSFEASERSGETIEIDNAFVDGRMKELLANEDLSRYIL